MEAEFIMTVEVRLAFNVNAGPVPDTDATPFATA
jgi:hypothetical protein